MVVLTDGLILRENAHTFVEKYGIKNFSVVQKKTMLTLLHHRRKCVDDNDIRQSLQNLLLLIKDYKLKDIFNCDEMGLLFILMVDKILSFKEIHISRTEGNKDRLTIFFAQIVMV